MAIAAYKPDAPKRRSDEKFTPTPKVLNTPVEFHSQQPLTTLLKYVDGSAWTVDYYRQITPDTVTSDTLDTAVDNPYQQFERLFGLKLKVQTALSPSYDESTAATKISGSSVTPSIFVPNINDYIVADVDAGIRAIFRVIQVERKSHMKEAVYEIFYQVIAYSNLNPDIFQTLTSKVVKDYHYDEELQTRSLKPLITTEEYKDRKMLSEHYEEILRSWCKSFYRRDLGLFLLPSQGYKIYDPQLMNFIYTVIGRTQTEELRSSHHLEVNPGNVWRSLTVFDAVLDRNWNMLEECSTRAVHMPRTVFSTNGWVRNARTSMLDYLVVPWTEDESLHDERDTQKVRYFSDVGMYEKQLTETKNHQGWMSSMLNFRVEHADFTKQLIHPVLMDDGYIFSRQWYEGGSETSVLEDLLTAYLKGQSLDVDGLKSVVSMYRKFGRLEQYYYGGFVMLLLSELGKVEKW